MPRNSFLSAFVIGVGNIGGRLFMLGDFPSFGKPMRNLPPRGAKTRFLMGGIRNGPKNLGRRPKLAHLRRLATSRP